MSGHRRSPRREHAARLESFSVPSACQFSWCPSGREETSWHRARFNAPLTLHGTPIIPHGTPPHLSGNPQLAYNTLKHTMASRPSIHPPPRGTLSLGEPSLLHSTAVQHHASSGLIQEGGWCQGTADSGSALWHDCKLTLPQSNLCKVTQSIYPRSQRMFKTS